MVRNFFIWMLHAIKRVINSLFSNSNAAITEVNSIPKPPWFSQYETGVPETINFDEYSSLCDIFNSSCHAFSERTAYSNMGEKLSYAEIDGRSEQFAAWLQNEVNLQKGDRVALMLPNVLQYPVALFGVLRAGGIVVNVNPMYSPRELEHQLNDSGAVAIIILENFAHTLEKVIDKVKLDQVVVTSLGDLFPFPKSKVINFMVSKVKCMVPKWHLDKYTRFNKTLSKGKQLTFTPAELQLEDIAFLQYTGGTTGVSKGVMLSHRNMIANITQCSLWASHSLDDAPVITIAALPLYHIFALTLAFFMPMKHGQEVMLITNPRDFRDFISLIKNTRFTTMVGVNTLFNAMLNTEGFNEVDFSSLRLTIGGGMAVTQDVAQRWYQVTGNHITQGYGLTETSPMVSANPLHIHEFNGSIGVPVSSTEITIMDDAGNQLEVGEVGEICIRGPQVMEGYWQRPDETEKVFFEGGWFRSGDIGRMDEKGFVYLADRKKDMILVSGFNVYPNEVEDVLTLHTEIIEAAVVGVKHDEKGEVVKAYIVRSTTTLTEEVILEHCRGQLTAYKVPKHIEFRSELPKSNVGKVLRRALRDEIEASSAVKLNSKSE
ncbi:MAG: long-chain-fatty-acid--CoA ligase [marine bacterium B5-7]|nr:MAG: long-chain-fatty-acid--CoA ligase [marine bacterium B5-7]